MKIKSLEQMEDIVKRNRQLRWDGWDVIKLQQHPGAWSKPHGAYIKGKWHFREVYPITESGWVLPDNLVR